MTGSINQGDTFGEDIYPAYGRAYYSLPVSATEPWLSQVASAYVACECNSWDGPMDCTTERVSWAASVIADSICNREVM